MTNKNGAGILIFLLLYYIIWELMFRACLWSDENMWRKLVKFTDWHWLFM